MGKPEQLAWLWADYERVAPHGFQCLDPWDVQTFDQHCPRPLDAVFGLVPALLNDVVEVSAEFSPEPDRSAGFAVSLIEKVRAVVAFRLAGKIEREECVRPHRDVLGGPAIAKHGLLAAPVRLRHFDAVVQLAALLPRLQYNSAARLPTGKLHRSVEPAYHQLVFEK